MTPILAHTSGAVGMLLGLGRRWKDVTGETVMDTDATPASMRRRVVE